jgi:hypothetical protein
LLIDDASDDFLDEALGVTTRREQLLDFRTKMWLPGTADVEVVGAEGRRNAGAVMEERLQTPPEFVHSASSGVEV